MPPNEYKKIVVVSDLHIGYDRFDDDAFLKFIKTYSKWDDVELFVLLGDTFDFWRRQNAEALVDNKELIECILSLPPKIVFVRGNHDYYLQQFSERFYKSTNSQSRNFKIENNMQIRSGKKISF